jgi:hypothetical protein
MTKASIKSRAPVQAGAFLQNAFPWFSPDASQPLIMLLEERIGAFPFPHALTVAFFPLPDECIFCLPFWIEPRIPLCKYLQRLQTINFDRIDRTDDHALTLPKKTVAFGAPV